MKKWYSIQNRATAAEIVIDDEIGEYGVSARQFARDLAQIKAPEISLRIFSPGGSVVQGFAIYNALLRHPARIVGRIDFAASMATVIAMACDEIEMSDNGFFMIHNPWAVAMGESDDLERMADLLAKMREKILDAYGRHSTRSRDELAALMDAETWMDAGEAMAAGFCSRIIQAPALAALADLDLSAFTNLPQAIATTHNQNGAEDMPDNKNKPEDLQAKLDELTAGAKAAAEANAALKAEVESLTATVEEVKQSLAVEKKAHAESVAEAAAAAKAAAEAHAAAIAEKEGALAKAEAKVAALAPGLKPDAANRANSNNGTPEGADAIAAFADAVAAIQERDGIAYNDALRKAKAEYPDEFAAYLKAPKPSK